MSVTSRERDVAEIDLDAEYPTDQYTATRRDPINPAPKRRRRRWRFPRKRLRTLPPPVATSAWIKPSDYRPTRPTRFFLWCAGVDRDLLYTRGEHYRYTNLGVFVLLIGILAAVSFTLYASIVTQSFHPLYIPMACGWGLLIFTLDRSIVGEPHYRDLDLRRFADKLSSTEPDHVEPSRRLNARSATYGIRFVIAALVAYLIGEALLLVLFSPEIGQVLPQRQEAAVRQAVTSYADKFDAESDELNTRIENLAPRLDTARQDEQTRTTELNAEINGTLTGIAGDGREADRKRGLLISAVAYRKSLEDEDKQARESIADLGRKSAALKQQDPAAIAQFPDLVKQIGQIKSNTGWVEQEAALQQYLDQNSTFTVVIAPWVVRILLLLIDLAPLIVKLSSGKTIYGHRQQDRAAQIRYSDAADDKLFTENIDRIVTLERFRGNQAAAVAQRRAQFHRDWQLTYFDHQSQSAGTADPERHRP